MELYRFYQKVIKMEIIHSTPDLLDFFDMIRAWFESQHNRIWICTPYMDNVTVSLINSSCKAKDVRVITRKNRHMDELDKRIHLKLNQDIHVKLYIGDASAHVGSANLTYASLMDNIELLLKIDDPDILTGLAGYFEVLWI